MYIYIYPRSRSWKKLQFITRVGLRNENPEKPENNPFPLVYNSIAVFLDELLKKKRKMPLLFRSIVFFPRNCTHPTYPRGTGAKCISRDAELFIATTLTSARGGTCNRRRRRRRIVREDRKSEEAKPPPEESNWKPTCHGATLAPCSE